MREVDGIDEEGEGIYKYKWVVVELSWECKVQHRK